MEKKYIITIVAVVIVVIVICAAGVVLLKKDNNSNSGSNDGSGSTEAKYWYYLDYGDNQSSTAQNGWVSADSGDTPADGLSEVTDCSINTAYGTIESINGVAPDWATTNESWGIWVWNSPTTQWQDSPVMLGNSTDTVFYIGVTAFDSTTYEPMLDPNALTDWTSGGPFANIA